MNTNMERQSVLSVASKTWSRDSHGLYDYESQQAKPAHTIITDNNYIVRRKLDIRTTSSLEEIKEDEFLMESKFDKATDKFYLNHTVPLGVNPTEKNINELQNKLWYVIKHDESTSNNPNNQTIQNKNEDYFICLNDIIKLGRVKYAANEINITKSNDMMDVDYEGDTKLNPYNISSVNQESKPVFDFIYKTFTPNSSVLEDTTCKICLSGGHDEVNPLVDLCRCSGGIKYSHYLCLKMWMQTKLSKKENEKLTVTSYNIKAFNCEICKTPYPFRFSTNGDNDKIYDLIEIIRPIGQNFIILESLNQLKDNNNLKSIHVIILEDKKITLGRGHESDLRVNDISVSRTHAVLTFNAETGKICIRDLKSKFGTLALLKTNVQIREKKLHLQIGRTYVEAFVMTYKDYDKMRKHRDKKAITGTTISPGIIAGSNNITSYVSSNTISSLGYTNPNALNNGGNFNLNNQNNDFHDFNEDANNAALKQFFDLSKMETDSKDKNTKNK